MFQDTGITFELGTSVMSQSTDGFVHNWPHIIMRWYTVALLWLKRFKITILVDR